MADAAGPPLGQDSLEASLELTAGDAEAGLGEEGASEMLLVDPDPELFSPDAGGCAAEVPVEMQEAMAGQEMPSPEEPQPLSIEAIGDRFQECIDAVEELEKERERLLQELTLLRQPALDEIRRAHEEVLEAYRRHARAELERGALRDEIRRVKRKLFRVARECVACQYQLETQRHDVAQFAICRQELEGRVQQLSEELAQLRESCQEEKEQFRQRLRAPRRSRRDGGYLQESRRLSVQFESFVLESRQELEEHYEPKLVRLLERREAGTKALRKTQGEIHRLKEALRPLQGEVGKLQLQNHSLEEQIVLVQQKRDEDILQYKEQIEELEERLRELKNEVQLQQRKNQELEALRASLHQELSIYKDCLEMYGQLCQSEAKRGES